MNSVLDQYIPKTSAFRPATARELFGLRLAQKLDDVSAFRHYLDLVDSYPESQLLSAYRRALRNGHSDRARQFHAELRRIHSNGHSDPGSRLISIRIERRTIALAVFDGTHLEHTDMRQLSSARDKAVASAVGFVMWMLDQLPVESAACELIEGANEIQRRVLHDAIFANFRERMVSLWEIPRAALYEAYGRPAIRSRAELRQIATSIWPVLAGTHAKVFIQDAAVLGLYVQTERQFIIN